MPERIPIIVLGGSDRKPGPVPRGLSPADMITGYKGAVRLPWGRCLAGEVIRRLRDSGQFEEPILVGPRRVYQGEVDCEVVHVAGNLPTTLRRVHRLVQERFPLTEPVAFITCDVIPTGEEIRELLGTGYAPHRSCMFWGQLIEAPASALGASAWKPSYVLRRSDGSAPAHVYPGHLVIARPAALRVRLTNYLLKLAYRYRNVDLQRKCLPMVAHGLGRLLWEDLVNLTLLQPPTLTFSIPFYCLRAYWRYRHGRMTITGFEDHVAKVFLHRPFRQSARGRPVVFSVTSILSLAKDIDTKAELEALVGQRTIDRR